MLIKAEQKYIRISPRKVKFVVDAIKKLKPQEALEHLKFVGKRSAVPIAKVLRQVIANAENNHNLAKEDLSFNKIEVHKGPTYKRWNPVSRGRAHSILKRTSHLKIILEGKEKQVKPEVKEDKQLKKPKVKKKTILSKLGRKKK